MAELSNELPEVVLASGNLDKCAELAAMVDGVFRVSPRPAELDETIEDGATLSANAQKKALEVAQYCGGSALADDSGLFVDWLDGAPGVYSARYAGEGATYSDNVAKLLSELEGVQPQDRTARFVTVVALAGPDGSMVEAVGSIAGAITEEPRGDRGFGYDPVFAPTECVGKTFAELTPHEKDQISHRRKAVAALLEQLEQK